MGKFVIKRTKSGFVFHLKAANGEIIAASEVYTTEAACRKGVCSVMRNALRARLEDQTAAAFSCALHPKFELYRDRQGEYRFRLKASNGQIIAVSEGYLAKKNCLSGIESVRRNAPGAPCVRTG